MQGFTLIELLLVIMIIGLLLTVILPRAQRATTEARFSIVRQHATEIGSYTSLWTQSQMDAKFQSVPSNPYSILTRTIQGDDASLSGFSSKPLVNLYTGHDHFRNQVAKLIALGSHQVNPFNSESYFSEANDHIDVNGVPISPSPKPGLLYLVYSPDNQNIGHSSGAFYFITTALTDSKASAEWYGLMGDTPETARHGIFVMRTQGESTY